MNEIPCRTQPCETCPYRRDVPSGVWSAEEYAKLPNYDKPTGEQPPAVFFCHTSSDFVCNGWANVHAKNPARGFEPLGLRFALIFSSCVLTEIPASDVPLFASGTEAAIHGLLDIKRPTRAARQAVAKVQAARRRRSGNERQKR